MAGFSGDERKAIQQIVRGGKAENISRALGKFGFTEGQASSMLLGSLGVAGGAAAFGAAGAPAIPIAGQVFKGLAQKLTRRNVQLADQVVRAGSDGRRIVSAYLKTVPKKDRKVEELTGLLLEGGADIGALRGAENKLIADAAYFASVIKAAPVPVEESEKQPLQE